MTYGIEISSIVDFLSPFDGNFMSAIVNLIEWSILNVIDEFWFNKVSKNQKNVFLTKIISKLEPVHEN